jgi:hypothetical protein
MTKACDLRCGDTFQLFIFGEVLTVAPVAGGKQVRVKLMLEPQRHLEFLDTGYVVELVCPHNRNFHLCSRDDDDDAGDSPELSPPLDDGIKELDDFFRD